MKMIYVGSLATSPDRDSSWIDAFGKLGCEVVPFCSEPAGARIPLPDDRVTCVSHNQGDENAYADLWLMTQCKHFIIANSTFSWWGAWLSDHAHKKVIAPGFEMRQGKMSWGFAGLLPERWIKL